VQPSLGLSSVTMQSGRWESMKKKANKFTAGVALSLALGMGIMAPKQANAEGEMEADGSYYYEPFEVTPPPSKGVDLVRTGFAAGAGLATFGGVTAVAIKKERKQLEEQADVIGEEITRLDNFKQEFLEGVVSDSSLLSSLNKALQGPTAVEEDEEEDEFEKNVRLFLEEEEAKEKKDKPENLGGGRSPSTLLERPSDPDGSETEAWMNDIVFEDKPAEIDSEQLERLQRMFGGSGDSDKPADK